MSRLERLVSLLDTGSSTYVRNVAGDQLADVQKSHPEELFSLLGRIAPFLKSKKWDTRISAARALGLILENAEWSPENGGVQAGLEHVREITQEVGSNGHAVKSEGDDVKTEVKSEPVAVKTEPLDSDASDCALPSIQDSIEVLTFAKLDIKTVITKGAALLGSAGKEYDNDLMKLDPADRLKTQQQNLKKQLGFATEFADDATADMIMDDDLELEPPKPKARVRGRPKAVKVEERALSEPPAEEPSAASAGNARMRALAKRKAKFGAKTTSKVQVVDVAPKQADQASSPGRVVVEHREDKSIELTNLVTVKDSKSWPFAALCEILMTDMFSPTWETRHGALLGLRELIKLHGNTAGMTTESKALENEKSNSVYLEDLACRLCCILALDRFADYVADEVVAPVRESCAQAIGTLLLHLPRSTCNDMFQVLKNLVLQSELGLEFPAWAASHGGMLGLMYFVSVRPDLLEENEHLFSELVRCVFEGLENDDDDVQAIAAATLLPITGQFIEQRTGDINRLLRVIWDSLAGLKDELSTSIGHVMDLLAKLCSHPKVLDILVKYLQDDPEHSFQTLVPRLYPFMRHSIPDVRKAVLRSLKIFLTIDSEQVKQWVDLRFLRLVFQNVLLEQNDATAALSLDLWNSMLDIMDSPEFESTFQALFTKLWPSAFGLLITPVGTARRFYKMDAKLLIKPSGAPFDLDALEQNSKSTSNAKVNIDGALLLGDVLLVEPEIFIRNKINGCKCLGRAIQLAGEENTVKAITSIIEQFDSPMSTQQLSVEILLEEYGKHAKAVPSSILDLVNPLLSAAMDRQTDTIYRDLNPILRAVRTQCQSLFSLMVSQGKLPSSSLPQLASVIEGDANAGPYAFSLTIATEMAGPTFEKLKSKISTDIQVMMEESLEQGRTNLNNAIEEARENLEKRNISLKANAAAAYLSLNEQLPTKLNPIIRSLMDSIKLESNQLIHDRIAGTVAMLVQRLHENDRAPVADKIVKNLCSFLCVDVKEAPVFHTQQDMRDGIMSLKKDEIPLKDISLVLRKQHESRVVFIKRQGALLALQKLSATYGMDLFEKLSELSNIMVGTLKSTDISNLPETIVNEEDTLGQSLIDNLAVVRALLPSLDPGLYDNIKSVFDSVKDALFSEFSVIRFVAAKCFSTICNVMPTVGISYFVENILPKINDADRLHSRQGAIESIYHLMSTMGEQVLPYIVFFIVPTMGRMSDSDNDIRTIAATTFASIIKLVPLESGIQDPPDMPAKLLEGRDTERKFISQMMDISKVEPFELPISVKAELRKYQQEGVNWLAFLNKYHLHGVLCDDMGLGKTLQTICIVASDHHMRAEEHKKTQSPESRRLPSFIICPTSLTGHWVQEFKKYVPTLKTIAYVGSPNVRSQLIPKFKDVDVVITSYDIARNDVTSLTQQNWNYCVLDEGHIIKNANSKLSKAVKQYVSNHRLVLSGTPIQNDVLELWSLFDFLMPGFLGSEKSFNERFSKPIIASKNSRTSAKEQEAAALALEALHKQVLPFLLRRLKEEVLSDLPPKIIQDYYCDLNDQQRQLYEQFTKQQRSSVEEDLKDKSEGSGKKHIFQALLYLRRLCNHPALVTYTKEELQKVPKNKLKEKLDYAQSPKLLALQQLLKDCGIGDQPYTTVGEVPEAMSQHRALIFCQQKDMLDLVENSLLKAHMPSVSYMRLDGSVAGTDRHEMVAKFNDDPSIDVLLLSTHVGGLGLNLTGADTVIFVEHDWNPMNDLQAMDRAHRIGQKKVVNVYRLITRNTLEERIMGLQEFKMNIASTVVNQQNSGLLSMDTDQILDLFSASSESSGPIDEESKPEDEIDATTHGVAGKEVIAGLGDLWDENEYAEEYNLDNFIKGLKKKNT